MRKRVLFIVNPASAGGRTLERWEEVVPKLEAANFDYDVQFTVSRGCATDFAKSATENMRCDTIVSVGGDGTANEIINGIMTAAADSLPAFTIFPSGTGSDTVRTLGIPKELETFVAMLEKNASNLYDVGIADFVLDNDAQGSRYFLNACDVGIGATVANTVNSLNQDNEKKSGKAKYFRSILEQVVKFKAFSATYDANGKAGELKNTVIVAICNGMFFGGGVKISPISRMNDGKLELIATENVSKPGLMGLVSKVYTGSHVGHPKVRFVQDDQFTVRMKKPQLLETDGEVQGSVKEVTFKIITKKLRIIIDEK